MGKVRISEFERWPDYYLNEAEDHSGYEVELPDDVIERVRAAIAEHAAVWEIMYDAYDAAARADDERAGIAKEEG